MAIEEIKRAAERHLNTMPSQWPTAYEGVPFIPPDGNYLRTQFRIDDPFDDTVGVGYHRERCQFQVFVVAVAGQGSGEAIRYAELIRDRFKKGTFLLESGVRIHTLKTPKVGSSNIMDGRILVPVLIDLTAEVES
jgi:hypothetical protein